ncbi:hypothetical protein NQ314_004159 [Rhamnusium bicolor]|uniref:Uncharacterized protein n=1 Tax=Rhamnusium bicolor TaxID=1586634 RepID=A0AAV8ZME1_9CUCU|nr:hypothetical protein NQ314_004159 [Rhamnusium bicolor]
MLRFEYVLGVMYTIFRLNAFDTAYRIRTLIKDLTLFQLLCTLHFRMEYRTFSCFDNFVPGSNCGAPEHTPMHHSILHLEKLICNLSERLQTMTENDLLAAMELSQKAIVLESDSEASPNSTTKDGQLNGETNVVKPWIQEDLHLEKYDIKLVGFSKGCVVLNQFLYEFHYFKTLKSDDSSLSKIIPKFKDMYWLDGGHSGIRIHIHVTPYQIRDDRRPWIKKEEKQFSDILQKQGTPINRTIHFENVPASLLLHFDVLKIFN